MVTNVDYFFQVSWTKSPKIFSSVNTRPCVAGMDLSENTRTTSAKRWLQPELFNVGYFLSFLKKRVCLSIYTPPLHVCLLFPPFFYAYIFFSFFFVIGQWIERLIDYFACVPYLTCKKNEMIYFLYFFKLSCLFNCS